MSVQVGSDDSIIRENPSQPALGAVRKPGNYLSEYEQQMTELLHSHRREAIKRLETDHAFGNLTATYLLGSVYFNRIFAAPDYEKAIEYWEYGAALGDVNCKRGLGDCYFHGYGREENDAKALEIYSEILREHPGELISMYQIARMTAHGWGIPKDPVRAIGMLEQTWNGGYYKAAGEIGEIYQFDFPRSYENIKNALKWYQRGSEKGDVQSCYRMGLFLCTGDNGVERDQKRADRFFMRALDNPSALEFLLADLSDKAADAFSPEEKAYVLAEAERRAEYGLTELQMQLGIAYGIGKACAPSREKATYWYERAISNGSFEAAWRLGNNYKYGWQGFEIDMQQAYKYYRIGADGDNDQCLDALCRLLEDEFIQGLEVGESERLQRYCLERRAQKGDKSAIGMLGKSLMSGYPPFKEDKKRALQCFEQIVEDQEGEAYNLDLARLYIDLHEADNYGKIIPCLERAAQYYVHSNYFQGEVAHIYGLIYRDGLGVQRNLAKAHDYLLTAVEKGFDPAKETLSHFKKGLFGWKLV